MISFTARDDTFSFWVGLKLPTKKFLIVYLDSFNLNIGINDLLW